MIFRISNTCSTKDEFKIFLHLVNKNDLLMIVKGFLSSRGLMFLLAPIVKLFLSHMALFHAMHAHSLNPTFEIEPKGD